MSKPSGGELWHQEEQTKLTFSEYNQVDTAVSRINAGALSRIGKETCRERRIQQRDWERVTETGRGPGEHSQIQGRREFQEGLELLKKLCGEVFNGTGCGNTRATGRSGKKRYGFWLGKYDKQSLTERYVKFIPENWLEQAIQHRAESWALKPDPLG